VGDEMGSSVRVEVTFYLRRILAHGKEGDILHGTRLVNTDKIVIPRFKKGA
jgi:hypothetical protein